jgi:hypothetical protein
MKCEDVVAVLRSDERADAATRRIALAHVAECDYCDAAAAAVSVLEADGRASIPRLAEGAFERALRRAMQPQPRVIPGRPGFWLGATVGGALAASIAVAIMGWWLQPNLPTPAVNPQVRLALNEVRAVNVALESAEALAGAEIHVVLTGGVGLEGFSGQRELRWVTDLDRGVNQLTLPLVAVGPNGGQVMVEVRHGDKRRIFVVDVQAAGAAPTARRVGDALAAAV